MFYGAYTDIWLNFPIKCRSTSYYGACTSIFAHRILRRRHEFLMPKLYMHTLLKSSPLLKNYAVIKVCLSLPSAQSNKVFCRTHNVAIIPPSWGWSGFCVPSVFPFHFNPSVMISLARISFCFELKNHWDRLEPFSMNLPVNWRWNDILHLFSAKFEEPIFLNSCTGSCQNQGWLKG